MHAVNERVRPSGSIPVRVALLLAGLAVASLVMELLVLAEAVHVLFTFVWGVLAIAAALLGERIDAETAVCALLVVALVFASRRTRVDAPQTAAAQA